MSRAMRIARVQGGRAGRRPERATRNCAQFTPPAPSPRLPSPRRAPRPPVPGASIAPRTPCPPPRRAKDPSKRAPSDLAVVVTSLARSLRNLQTRSPHSRVRRAICQRGHLTRAFAAQSANEVTSLARSLRNLQTRSPHSRVRFAIAVQPNLSPAPAITPNPELGLSHPIAKDPIPSALLSTWKSQPRFG
jgi:hypothetical protein